MHSGDMRRNWPLPRQRTTSCAPPLCPRTATQMQTEPRLRRNSPIPASSNESGASIAKHGNKACPTPGVLARTRSTASGRRCGHGLKPIPGGHRSRCCLSFSSGARDVTPTVSYGPCSGACANGGVRFWRLSMASGSNWIGSARLQNLRATEAVEKSVAPRPWKTLRVSHFPTASTAGRTLPFDRSFGNISNEATDCFWVTFSIEAIRSGVLIVADHRTASRKRQRIPGSARSPTALRSAPPGSAPEGSKTSNPQHPMLNSRRTSRLERQFYLVHLARSLLYFKRNPGAAPRGCAQG